MKTTFLSIFLALIIVRVPMAQTYQDKQETIVITGVRFAYPLVQKWIDEYAAVKPEMRVVIEPRGVTDPSGYDILIDAWEHREEMKQNREYLYIARYAILPVANSKSGLAARYGEKGLTKDMIKQMFFHDIYGDYEDLKEIKEPYEIYTRMQNAGSPSTFARFFGYEQKDIKGNAIAGSDGHLLQAILRDSAGVSYLPLPLVYDRISRKPVDGLTVFASDLNGNGRINSEEKFYDNLDAVILRLESALPRETRNIPMEYLHLSVDRNGANPDAVEFLQWIIQNGRNHLYEFGFIFPEPHRFETKTFDQLVLKNH